MRNRLLPAEKPTTDSVPLAAPVLRYSVTMPCPTWGRLLAALPPIVAVLVAILLRRPLLALFLGVFSGAVLIKHGFTLLDQGADDR